MRLCRVLFLGLLAFSQILANGLLARNLSQTKDAIKHRTQSKTQPLHSALGCSMMMYDVVEHYGAPFCT